MGKIIHLYRWTRTVASTAVAMFLVLVGANVYIDSGRTATVQPEVVGEDTSAPTAGTSLNAPAVAPTTSPVARTAPTAAEPAAAARVPVAAQKAAEPPSAPAALTQATPVEGEPTGETDPHGDGEQFAATRGAAALPEPASANPSASTPAQAQEQESGDERVHSLLRDAAVLTGLAASVTLLLALALRRRMR